MTHHMRQKEREITDPAAIEGILRKGKYATLALCRDGMPYVVTLSYGYDPAEKALYFHCAPEGAKTDFARANPRACCTVIEDRGYVQTKCKHAFRSVVVRGRLEILTEAGAKHRGLDVLIDHLEQTPEIVKSRLPDKADRLLAMHVWRLVIEEVTGKEGE